MAKASQTLQKGGVVQHTLTTHTLIGKLPREIMETTNIGYKRPSVTLNCRSLWKELQQTALSRLLRYLHAPFAALQETSNSDPPIVSNDNYIISCGDADERKVGGFIMGERNDYNNLVEEFGSTSSRCAFERRDRRGVKLWIVRIDAPTETATRTTTETRFMMNSMR
ncbi:hypothetical protein RB195_003369 [Necator americanus]|uniref:Uncharacterized protein n=1 Tax=Necator americanus TaxID=51031 RepID=A0ABR1DN89_NECAM